MTGIRSMKRDKSIPDIAMNNANPVNPAKNGVRRVSTRRGGPSLTRSHTPLGLEACHTSKAGHGQKAEKHLTGVEYNGCFWHNHLQSPEATWSANGSKSTNEHKMTRIPKSHKGGTKIIKRSWSWLTAKTALLSVGAIHPQRRERSNMLT
jgi:hypothetical protein